MKKNINRLIISSIFILLSVSLYSETIDFELTRYRDLLLNESALRQQIRDKNDEQFKRIVYNLDFNLLDSVFKNINLLKPDFEELKKSDKPKLDPISYATIQSLAINYQEGNQCYVPKEYYTYIFEILHKLLPAEMCDAYGFQFIFYNYGKGGLGATIKYNGTIAIPLNTFGTPISDKENYLAFLIAHEVAHNLLYKSLTGKKKIEVECNRLACMLLKHAGYSVNILQEYLDYCYLYQDLFAKGGDKRKSELYNFYWDYSEDILKEFDTKEGQEVLVSESTYDNFREYCITKSLINISSTNRSILEVNINHSILNLVEHPTELIWQVVFLESLRRMMLFEYVQPTWRAFAFKQDPLILTSLPENVKKKYYNSEIGLLGIIEFFEPDSNLIIDGSLKSLITYSDFFNYFLSKGNKTTEFKNIKFLYEKSIADSTNNRYDKNNTASISYMFVNSTSNKLKFIDTFNEDENIIDNANYSSNLLLTQKVDESIYYGCTQILSLLNYWVRDYSKIKYSSIYAYNFLENIDNGKLNLKQINVWRISSKLGVYGSGAMAIIKQSTFWLGVELGFVVLNYTPFTTIKDYTVDTENQTISKNKKIKIGNMTSQKGLTKIVLKN